jgi:hypothetical protein
MKKFIGILVFTCLLSLSISFEYAVENSELTENAYLWQGFNHKWERAIFNFLTPHRIGSLGNRIMSENFNEMNSSAQIEFTFTPGINGDYAFPSTNFSIIHSHEQSDTKFSHSKIFLNFTDQAEGNPPVASMRFLQNVSLPTYDYEQIESVINGFDLKMKCLDEKCNSNGIWPTKFFIDVSNCYQMNEEYICLFEFILERGWTPDNGTGKAFNYKMSYSVQVNILCIHSNPSNLAVFSDEIHVQSDLHYGPISLKRNTTLEGKIVSGITAFGFELKKYKNYEALGRYIWAIQFELGNPSNGMDYNVSLNLNSAKWTTYFCETELLLKTKSFVFKDKEIKSNLKTSGRVCKEDHSSLFFCYLKGIPNKQSDLVNYTTSIGSLK